MLGRAKWDAWERQRGYTTQDAKQLYVESMLKVLRRFKIDRWLYHLWQSWRRIAATWQSK